MPPSPHKIFKIEHSETPFPAFLRQGWSSLEFSLKIKKNSKKKKLKKHPNIGIKVLDVE